MVKCEVRMTKVQMFWNGVCILSSSYAEINFVGKRHTYFCSVAVCPETESFPAAQPVSTTAQPVCAAGAGLPPSIV